jgi:hypothetical protein
MRTALAVAWAAVATFVTGSIASLQPLYSDVDLILDRRLLGTWVEDDDQAKSPDRIAFERQGDDAYTLTYTSKGKPVQYEAHLVQFKGAFFLDLAPPGARFGDKLQRQLLVPAHSFVRLWIDDETQIRMAVLDDAWMRNAVAQKKAGIPFEQRGDRILLTAATPVLQRFAVRYAEDTRAWTGWSVWARRAAPRAPRRPKAATPPAAAPVAKKAPPRPAGGTAPR